MTRRLIANFYPALRTGAATAVVRQTERCVRSPAQGDRQFKGSSRAPLPATVMADAAPDLDGGISLLRGAQRLPRACAAETRVPLCVPRHALGQGCHRGDRRSAHRGRPRAGRWRVGGFYQAPDWRGAHRGVSGVRALRYHAGHATAPAAAAADPVRARRPPGKLARYLRLLGFDTLYRTDFDDAAIIAARWAEARSILTRDRGLLKHGAVTHGHWVRATDPRRQIGEIIRAFDLGQSVRPFTRCLRCNGVLQPVDKDAIADRLPPLVRAHFAEFVQCPECEARVLARFALCAAAANRRRTHRSDAVIQRRH